MRNRMLSSLALLAGVSGLFGAGAAAQETSRAPIRVAVDLVQLNVAVTDRKGHYVTGLRPQDFVVTEDGIREEIAMFGEGNESASVLTGVASQAGTAPGPGSSDTAKDDARQHVTASELSRLVSGANVFVLFDPSNYMYRGFVFAQDAIFCSLFGERRQSGFLFLQPGLFPRIRPDVRSFAGTACRADDCGWG